MFAARTCRTACRQLPILRIATTTQRMRTCFIDYHTHLGKKRITSIISPELNLASKRCLHQKNAGTADETVWLLRFGRVLWSKMFGKYLFATNVIGSGVLMVVGDIIAQEYEFHHGLRHEVGYDYPRVWRMFLAGALQGPLHHWVYNWMDRVMPGRSIRTTVNKILIDQLIMSPVCIVVFFYSLCFLERQSLESTNRELIQKFPYIYLLDWIFWPAAQYVNFRYLDTKYRVAFVNVCTAVYNVFMSYMKHDFGIELSLDVVSENPPTPISVKK